MPKVSVNILTTKNRNELLHRSLNSVSSQSFGDFEVLVVDDGSTVTTKLVLDLFSNKLPMRVITHEKSSGITISRQEALMVSQGEYVAILDDDDTWADQDKLKKQVEFLDKHPKVVLVGGGINIGNLKLRPESDEEIRKTMLFRNNFFTSTVMFRKDAAIKAGGFIKDADDFAEDYDLWLRLGKIGKMYNFQEAFANYRVPNYNKARYKAFLAKQLRLIYREKQNYSVYLLANILLKLRAYLW